ncbi:MAG: endonuclease MutS2 [Pyrinomonadaceae bacterium]|nr:endonuclease MutS2 [Pyrinomonadaceae bacterium]
MNSLATLEYDRLLALVAKNAQTPMGRFGIENLNPLTSRLELERDLSAISETISINEEKQVSWSFSGLEDPSEAVSILGIKNAALEPQLILEIARLCNQALFARSVIAPEKDSAPTLWQIVEMLPTSLFDILSGISRKLLPSGEVDDSASPELSRLRHEINAQRVRLQKSLEKVIRASGDAIQDQIVTVRNERYVIPVKSDFSGKVSGVAHGSSSSGATVFIEPLEAIEANNELQKLKGKEEREVARIIFAITEELRAQLPAIELAVNAVAELDFIKAKVVFAQKYNAVVPCISQDETLELIDARHPLLEENLRKMKSDSSAAAGGSDIVPVSFKLSDEKPVMIISGANAGGKTVVMKTAGLLSLMAISGLPVPAADAKIPFYRSVLADIGDHQSLSANLSTFSSHISNIAEMMSECRPPSLVLLDEVGTGTDPDEGSALGVAIVDHFRRECSAQVIASTHYRGLKIYAANDENVINASVEFDEKTLQPTYRLLTGIAGASSGIEIARRFGIIDSVIAAARENLDISAQEAESYLHKLQKEARQAEDLTKALEEEREAVAMKFASLDIEASKKEKQRQKEFENKLSETIEGFERQSRAFIKTIEDKALKTKLEKERLARKAELNRAVVSKLSDNSTDLPTLARNIVSAFDDQAQPQIVEEKDGKIEAGTRVLTSFGQVGKVEKVDGETADILVGSMRLREKLSNLKPVAEVKNEESRAEKLQKKAKESTIELDSPDAAVELNLIGQTTADAEYELDRFLDESYIARVPKIRIIHGFGTGALKNFVHHFLKNHPHVEKFGFAPQNQGGNGATIVELKQ